MTFQTFFQRLFTSRFFFFFKKIILNLFPLGGTPGASEGVKGGESRYYV